MRSENCVFCKIIRGEEPGEIEHENDYVILLRPLRPVVEGHMLVIPKAHVEDFTESSAVTADAAAFAALFAAEVGDCNLITSRGRAATQSVKHLHFHIVPRKRGDGLKLPWSRR